MIVHQWFFDKEKNWLSMPVGGISDDRGALTDTNTWSSISQKQPSPNRIHRRWMTKHHLLLLQVRGKNSSRHHSGHLCIFQAWKFQSQREALYYMRFNQGQHIIQIWLDGSSKWLIPSKKLIIRSALQHFKRHLPMTYKLCNNNKTSIRRFSTWK